MLAIQRLLAPHRRRRLCARELLLPAATPSTPRDLGRQLTRSCDTLPPDIAHSRYTYLAAASSPRITLFITRLYRARCYKSPPGRAPAPAAGAPVSHCCRYYARAVVTACPLEGARRTITRLHCASRRLADCTEISAHCTAPAARRSPADRSEHRTPARYVAENLTYAPLTSFARTTPHAFLPTTATSHALASPRRRGRARAPL